MLAYHRVRYRYTHVALYHRATSQPSSCFCNMKNF
jgi:hypothetical protein